MDRQADQRGGKTDRQTDRQEAGTLTMVEVRGVTQDGVPHSRVVELEVSCIDQNRERASRDQLHLHCRLILVPEQDKMEKCGYCRCMWIAFSTSLPPPHPPTPSLLSPPSLSFPPSLDTCGLLSPLISPTHQPPSLLPPLPPSLPPSPPSPSLPPSSTSPLPRPHKMPPSAPPRRRRCSACARSSGSCCSRREEGRSGCGCSPGARRGSSRLYQCSMGRLSLAQYHPSGGGGEGGREGERERGRGGEGGRGREGERREGEREGGKEGGREGEWVGGGKKGSGERGKERGSEGERTWRCGGCVSCPPSQLS